MAYDNEEFGKLINSIKDKSFDSETLSLGLMGLDNRDFSSLIEALKSNPDLMAKIKRVNLSFNDISDLGDFTFSDLPNLMRLDIISNKLQHLPNLDGCRKLQIIKLSKNNITGDIPALNLPSLKVLDLSTNKITNTPNIEQCPRLEEFNLEFNSIEDITPQPMYKNVKTLAILQGNPLSAESKSFLESRNAKTGVDLSDLVKSVIKNNRA